MAKGSNTLVKNSILFSIAPFLPKVVNIILLPIMTKYLTDVDFGISGTISAYTQAIGAFSTLGLTVALMNSFYKNPDGYRVLWKELYGFLNLWMIFFAAIQAVILFFCIPEEAAENKWWIILLSQFNTVVFGPTGVIGNSYFVYNKQSVPVVWRSVAASLITILVDFILIVYLKFGYMGWYVGTFVGTLFTNASYWPVIHFKLGIKPVYKFRKGSIKNALNLSLPTIPHYYTNYLLEGSGRMVLNQYGVEQGEIGRVSISQQMGDVFQLGISGLNNAISPYCMQSLKDNDEKKIVGLGKTFACVIFVLAFLISLWSKELFSLLISNSSLQSAYPFFILYIMAFCYRPLYLTVANYYFYYEHTKQLLTITFASGILGVLFYIAFVPLWGAWAFFIGHYISCLYYGYSGYLYKGYRSHSSYRFPFYIFLVVQILLTLGSFVLVEHIILKSVITGLVILLSVVLFFKFKQEIPSILHKKDTHIVE